MSRILVLFLFIPLFFFACGNGGTTITPSVPNISKPASAFFEENMTILKRNGKHQIFDRIGKQLVNFNEEKILAEFDLKAQSSQLSSISHFKEGLSEVFLKTPQGIRWGYINKNGKNPFGKMFEYAGEFEKGLSIIKEKGKWGIINTKGKYVVEAKHQGISTGNSNDRYWAKNDNKWVLHKLDTHEPLSEVPLRIMGRFNEEGVCWVEKRTVDDTKIERAFMDKNGQIVSPWYDNANDFSDGLASFKRNGKWGYVDSKGQVAIEAQFGYAGTFQGGVAGFTTVDDDEFGKWGVINKRGNKILPMIFPWFKSCKNGFCIVRGENNKDGFASLKGNWITKPEYDNAYQFHEGLAAVNQGELWGFINEKGELVINYQYEQVIAFPNDPFNGGFSGGIAKVQSDGTQFFIDKSGNCVLGCLE